MIYMHGHITFKKYNIRRYACKKINIKLFVIVEILISSWFVFIDYLNGVVLRTRRCKPISRLTAGYNTIYFPPFSRTKHQA